MNYFDILSESCIIPLWHTVYNQSKYEVVLSKLFVPDNLAGGIPMNTNLVKVLDIANRVHILLTTYIEVNDHIFKPSIRKRIPIPGIFQKINYHSCFLKLSDIGAELVDLKNNFILLIEEFDGSTPEYKFIYVLTRYCEALLNTVFSLKSICFKTKEKIDGNSTYDYSLFDKDVEEYNNHVKNYLSYGDTVNQYYKEIVNK